MIRPAVTAAAALLVLSTTNNAAADPQMVVTAAREPAPALTLPGNTARIDADSIRLLGHTHASQLGAQAAGTWLGRGAEQESLPAIRSPVLTGPGSCGAFLMLEDGIPVRPAGFCNVNQLFEMLTEQSVAMEVVRGPAGALYGANGLHGTLNFLLPEPGAAPGSAASGELGPNHYWRTRLGWDGMAGADPLVAGLVVDHDSDFRADAGYGQAKGFAKLRHATEAGDLEFGFAATMLDQESAGYITGYEAYADDALRTGNLNPEAYRDADSQRLTARFTPAAGHPLAGTEFSAVLRRSRMDFLQHFLPGKPREENGQWSAGLMTTTRHETAGGSLLTAGLDVEFARGFLEEYQDGDSGIGTLPTGAHYDYEVDSALAAPFAQLALPLGADWLLQLGLRVEVMRYDYDNRMADGSTREDGTPCTPAPCRYSRPADRNDDFLNVAPNVALRWRIAPPLAAWLSLTHGFRPPQATELYRLQAGQLVADLDSETLDSAELGLHWEQDAVRLELATFAMRKRHVIFQDISRANVSDGKTHHAGIEAQADLRLPSGWFGSLAASYARQTYAFDARSPGGEVIRDGNDVDTAPRTLASARLGYERGRGTTELEWTHVGDYYLDAANLARYGGHDLLNLHSRWQLASDWWLGLRLVNLADKHYAERADFVSFPAPGYRYFPGRERELYLELGWRSR